MFSGIVEALGEVRSLAPGEEGLRVTLAAPFADLAQGESVCVSGVCLTVVSIGEATFDADLSPETVRRSTLGRLRVGDAVNLERSLRLGDRLSGHMVFGHVDGTGILESITPEGDSSLYRFTAPSSVERYLVEKGSVAVDGVSLTVFACARRAFTVAVIPHTASVTTLGRMKPGSPVNLEADMIGKYVEKLVTARQP
ncbi:MAG: riboflavin synthase [Candidatus Binatia bacterium]